MRRVLSIILFVLGGWWLMSEAVMAWFSVPEVDSAFQLGVLAVIFAFAAPFLLLGMWASPGNHFREIGLTMMISVGIGSACAAITMLVFRDPGFKQMMPPDKPMPDIHFSIVLGVANMLLLGGGGWLLWRFGSAYPRRPEPELEQIFGDG